jgi:putative transposase
MARRPRLEYAGAVYHVMDRGDRGEDIFLDPEDRRRFLRTLGQVCERTGWRVHSFVLMRNHYHLLLETPEPNLSRGMHWLQTTYTTRHNKRHALRGHLFQGRYKSIPVEADADDYFATVSAYIHLNPARARLLRSSQKLADYVWSSFPLICEQPRNRPEWLEASRALGSCGEEDNVAGRRRYRADLEKRAAAEAKDRLTASARWKPVRESWAFGSDEFRRLLRRQWAEHAANEKSAAAIVEHGDEEATRLITQGLAMLKLGDLTSLPANHPGKVALAAFVKRRTTVTNRWLGEILFMGSYSNVSRLCGGVERNPASARMFALLENSKKKA